MDNICRLKFRDLYKDDQYLGTNEVINPTIILIWNTNSIEVYLLLLLLVFFFIVKFSIKNTTN